MEPCEFYLSSPQSFTLHGNPPVYLADFQRLGIFTGHPGQPVNNFTEDDLLRSTFIAYKGGRYLIKKGAAILACSPDLQILPKVFGHFFDHGDNHYSDNPCKETILTKAELNHSTAIKAILPYLQAIPEYIPK